LVSLYNTTYQVAYSTPSVSFSVEAMFPIAH
jgi:hypothetical protein